jgi:phage terminase large subunit GpA-like protein
MFADYIKGFLDGLRPVKRLTVSEWADSFRMLPSVGAAEPGPYRTDRTPYMREIMDCLSETSDVREVVFMKAAQIGATEAANNWIGYIIDIAPAPSMMVMPTDDTVKRNSRIRIDPMIQETPTLRERIKPARSRDSGNTVFSKDFPGGVLVMTGANSAVALRSMPVKNLILDEVDGYPLDLDGEGSPVELARARTRTFARRKILLISTPTVEGQSVIEAEFQTTDQRYYQVPCPHCGVMQALEFEQLVTETGKTVYDYQGSPPTAVYYKCTHCSELIEERMKMHMLPQGQWVSFVPENYSQHRRGYHLNSLYSPLGFYSWLELSMDYLKAKTSNDTLKTFFNTVLGKTWAEPGESPPWENLYNRRENYALNAPPAEVAFITAGVDVQKDRLELEIVGWCKGKRSYSIDYRVLLGDTAQLDVWEQLAAVVSETWERADGVLVPLSVMAIDAGYNTSHVYTFCRRFDATKVIPTKGQEALGVVVSPPRQVDTSRSGKKVGGVKVWGVGVSVVKSEIYGWLRQEIAEDGTPPPGYCHFPQYDQHFFKGLTAEELKFRIVRGFRKYEWVKKYERNEPLDCRVYARAAASVVGMDRFQDHHWDTMRNSYGVSRSATQQKQKRRSSGFW